MTEYTGGSEKAEHLCVLVHGLWGNPGHMASIAEALRAQHAEDRLYLLMTKTNTGTFTYDGIETGGERVCAEIEETLASVAARGGHIVRLSLVGYSLGGLVARYAVGLLQAKGVLDGLECVNFTAFASPFLGVRSPRRGVANTVWNTLGGRLLSMSGRQLFGIDTFRDTGRPLLSVLADPQSVFMAGLARFRRRTLYANIINDRSAPYYTTAIARTDPYAAVRADGGEVDDLPLQFVPGYEEIVLDRTAPVNWPQQGGQPAPGGQGALAHKSRPRKSQARWLLEVLLASPWSKEARASLRNVAQVLTMLLLLPLGVTAFLAHAAYETVRSRQRRRLHEGGLAGVNVSQYRGLPLWIKTLHESLQETAEDAYESLNGAQEPDHLAYGDDAPVADPTHTRPADEPPAPAAPAQPYEQLLALSPEQFAMVDALDALGWRKYPIWIHKLMHSHAAIIYRHQTPRYDEGTVVLRHYVEEEFLI